MGNIVRRVTQAPIQAQPGGELQPEKFHSSGGIFAKSQLLLGIEPKLQLSWSVLPRYWTAGFTLMVFHSTTGFCPERFPDDLNRHGQLIIETLQDDCREEHPGEGTHYYTFLLHRKTFFGLVEDMSILRFSETVPSARVAIERIRNRLELDEMRRQHELSQIEHESRLNEAEVRRIRSREKLQLAQEPTPSRTGGLMGEALAGVDEIIAGVLAKRKKIQDLKRDKQFKSLTKGEREEILAWIDEHLHLGEMSARMERRER